MEFTERRYSVLLVSSSPKFNESMLALLPESRFYPVAAVSDVSSARRRLLESKYDIVIINAPLPDDFGTRLALYICENSGAGFLHPFRRPYRIRIFLLCGRFLPCSSQFFRPAP